MHRDFPRSALDILAGRSPLTPLDPGEYGRFKAGSLDVVIHWYRAGHLGNVCLLEGRAALGLMRMWMLVINPRDLDMPLYSWDLIGAMGRYTLIVELYNTFSGVWDDSGLMAVKAGLEDIPDHELGRHWYDGLKLPPSTAKKTGRRGQADLGNASTRFLEVYLDACKAAPAASGGALAADYVDGLMANGGPSTDAFVKALGPERTRDLFTRIVFGTAGS